MIHMKYRVLFSLRNTIYFTKLSAVVVISVLRINELNSLIFDL